MFTFLIMKIVLNIEKRYAYLIIGLLILGVGIIVVNAYNSAGTGGTPSVMGHSVDEIDWSQTIESLKVNSINLSGEPRVDWPSTSSALPAGYYEIKGNYGEDEATPFFDSYYRTGDTCDGNFSGIYVCGVDEERDCDDVNLYLTWVDGGEGYYDKQYKKRTVSCKAGKVMVKLNSPPSEGDECMGTGLVYVIPNPNINDGGTTTGWDDFEVYCYQGIARWCLSGEACPWRNDITSSSDKTCSNAGLGSDWMATVIWGDKKWNDYSSYYCNAEGQKSGN